MRCKCLQILCSEKEKNNSMADQADEVQKGVKSNNREVLTLSCPAALVEVVPEHRQESISEKKESPWDAS